MTPIQFECYFIYRESFVLNFFVRLSAFQLGSIPKTFISGNNQCLCEWFFLGLFVVDVLLFRQFASDRDWPALLGNTFHTIFDLYSTQFNGFSVR